MTGNISPKAPNQDEYDNGVNAHLFEGKVK